MPDTLSQNESDLLFSAGSEGDVDASLLDAVGDPLLYDFRHPERIPKDRKRSLEAIYELHAKSLEGWITGRARDQIEVELHGVEQLTFGEFVLSLPSPCASFKFAIKNMRGQQGVVDFGHDFAFYLVDRLLGGATEPAIPDRALSSMERKVVRIVADRAAQQLSEVWRDYVVMDVELSGFESIPEMLQIANREDSVLLATLSVTFAGTSSKLLMCLPFAVAEKFFTAQSKSRVEHAPGSEIERARDRRHIEDSLRNSRVSVGARLPEIRLPMRELASLTEGGVLATGLSPETELFLSVSGQKRFRGIAGRVGKRLAVRVLEAIEPDPSDDAVLAGRETGP